jgi:glucan 1,3-beta-glucosidase
MKLVASIVVSFFALGVTCRQFKIPEVDEVVKDILSEYKSYVDFHGNHTSHSTLSERQASSYWYENIQHQGISAFGASGYKVYRNVKDYGAKGRYPHISFSHASANFL